MLLSGSAGLMIEGEEMPRILRPGDYVEIRKEHGVVGRAAAHLDSGGSA